MTPSDGHSQRRRTTASPLGARGALLVALLASLTAALFAGSAASAFAAGTTPEVSRETLWNPTSTSIQLNAKVNANNSELTRCQFEWGTSTAYGHTVPCEAAISSDTYLVPADGSDHVVSARLSGLMPSTEYHFRLLAANSSGETPGPDRTLTTLAAPAPESCSNQVIREHQSSTQLPDCRAWEMVTPLEKGHGDIVGDGISNQAASDGSAISYLSRTAFGDTIGSGTAGRTDYVARRSEAGWSSHAITPTPAPEVNQTFFGSTRLNALSADLRTAFFWAYDLPGATGDEQERINIYSEETANRVLTSVTPPPEGPASSNILEFNNEANWGMSPDGRHLAFASERKLLPGAHEGVRNLYQWDEGILSIAGILPGATSPPATGSFLVTGASGNNEPETHGAAPYYPQAMSNDGSRQIFEADPNGSTQLYQRIDGDRSVWLSEPEGEDQSEPAGVVFLGATPDGHTAFFTTESRLLDEDENNGADLYRWTDSPDPAHEPNLTLISHGGDLADAELVGFSDDGKVVYYFTSSRELVAWAHGTTRTIISGVGGNAGGEGMSVAELAPGYARVTPDGAYLAFLSDTQNTNERDPLGNDVRLNSTQAYTYSLQNDALRCISCSSGHTDSSAKVSAAAANKSSPPITSGSPQPSFPIRPRYLAPDGTVFFSTAASLVGQDTNGVDDAYEYEPLTGRTRLLSSGRGGSPSAFIDAGTSGNDAFFITRQSDVLGDSDELVDIYDARSGGGFQELPAPVSAACADEACQGVPASPPPGSSTASRESGAGNLLLVNPVAVRTTRPVHRPRCKTSSARHGHRALRRCHRKVANRKQAKHRGPQSVELTMRTRSEGRQNEHP